MIWKDKLIIVPWILSVSAIVFSASIVAVNFSGDNSQFVINYSYVFKPLLSDVNSLYSVLGIISGLLIVNSGLTFYVYRRERFLSYVISIATLAISLIFLITILSVTSIN